MPPAKVILLSLPFSSANYPNMALGLLKPALASRGIGCDVRYFSLDYIECSAAEDYRHLADPRYYMALVGEWVFAAAAHGTEDEGELGYLAALAEGPFAAYATAPRLLSILEARAGAAAFIEECASAVDWRRYAVVGLTSSFQQNMASLALARRLKERFPHLLIVFGGANCQDEMGIELHRRYPFVDAICLGEGERAFPELVRRHLAGEDCEGIAGMVVRRGGETVVPGRRTDPVEDLDSLPYPDFADFYAQHARSPAAAAAYPTAAVFETSRGCWWGAKHHCTFCGLNGVSLAYRSKSQRRAYDELAWLAERWGGDLINADNILDPRYFSEFIPRLAAEGPRVSIYYEMKANLRPEQLTLLARAGITKIQPGIESFSTPILRLMDKGSTMLQNAQTLKLAAENGVYVEWIALGGFPGETAAQYREMAPVLRRLIHLQPPLTFTRARADRFSPYFYHSEKYEVTLEPAAAYRFIYPFEEASVRRLAYHFDMHSPQLDAWPAYAGDAADRYAEWREHQSESALVAGEEGDAVIVADERWGWPRAVHVLEGAAAAIHRLCWKITPRRVIAAALAGRHSETATGEALDRLEELGLVLREGDSVLALALRQPGFRRAPSWAEIRAGETLPYTFAAAPPAAALMPA